MNSDLDARLGKLKDHAEAVVAQAKKRGASVAEAIARTGQDLSITVRKGEVEHLEEAGRRSLGLRVIQDGRVALVSTNDLSTDGLERLVSDAMELVQVSQADSFAGPADPSLLLQGPAPELDLFDPAMSSFTVAQAIDAAKAAEKAAFDADKRITNSDGASFSRTVGGFALALSSGFSRGYSGSFASLVVSPLADDVGDKKRRGFHYSARRHLADLDTPESIGKEAARRTLRKLGAKKVDTCEAPVVFDPDAARSILALVAGCTMGGSIWRKSSYLLDREGTVIASPLVTIVDDPLMPRGPGSRPFDGEGLASRKNVLVREGKLEMYLCDSYSARKLKRAPTGSASRGGSGGVGASTSNFILEPGNTPPEEILRQTKRGLYVTEMMGFGFNAVTGDFSRGASGFWIEGGEFAFPVSEVTISLNLDKLLQSIDFVGSDLDLRSSTAAPTIRVASMTISGAS